MAQKFVYDSNYGFTVEQVPAQMEWQGETENTGFFVNRRTDTGAVLGIVTERYGIMQNADLINSAEETFAAQGLAPTSRKIVVADGGKRMHAVYDFTSSRTKKMAKVGDELGLRLTVQNSFDGSLCASFRAGSLRLVCSNGMVIMSKDVGITRKHGLQLNISFVRTALQKAIEAWDGSFLTFERLAQVSISQMDGAAILSNLVDSKAISGKMLEGITPIWQNPSYNQDEERSLWSLYNAATQFLTHSVSPERFELAERASSNILSELVKGSRNFDKLRQLLTPSAV